MNNQPLTLENRYLRLVFNQADRKIDGFSLDIQNDGQWQRLGGRSPLSQVIYRDGQGARQVLPLPAQPVEVEPGRLKLVGVQADPEGVEWTFTAWFSLADDASQVKVDYRLETSQERAILQWLGPGLAAGEGSFGAAKDEALFPGLEYLLDDEPSSDTRFAAEKYARRSVPHPYKITVPLMAVSYTGQAVGMMWDPNQDWHNAWRHPAALFSSPDTLTPGAQRHQMAIFAPSVEPRWLNEGESEAHTPCDIAPGHPWMLSAWLTAVPQGGVLAVLSRWIETFGLPELPIHANYPANADLCVRSFLDVAWDESAQGWHHTLSDPWGARFETNLANLLWRYSRWSQGNPQLRARAEEQVRRAVLKERIADAPSPAGPLPKGVPHLDLALVYGDVPQALDHARDAAQKAMAKQQADGSWPWNPETVGGGGLKTQERLELMGHVGDSATGFTASAAMPVRQYALATGDPQAVESLRRAVTWCNLQRRPEGAQAWELHLHVPDVLAAPYLMQINLGMYHLSGDESYLAAANKWAWSGLPFTYLWNAYYRPLMRYGTIPVFGVTFHDIQPWFGVIVQWNGLLYAKALTDLACFQPNDGAMDWRKLAEGITQHGMQEQVDFGPYLGMYPDAFSPVRGDEEYTWWLNPQLLALNTFPLAGLQALPDVYVLRGSEGRCLHVTSGGRLLQVQGQPGARVTVQLADQPGEVSYILLAGSGKPANVACEGQLLPESDDLDTAKQDWQWCADHQLAIVKLCQPQAQSTLQISW